MKRHPFLKKICYLMLLSIFLFILNACGKNNSTDTQDALASLPTRSAMVTKEPVQPSDQDSAKKSDKEVSTSNEEASADNNETSAYNEALTAYDDFLAGSIDAQDIDHEISEGVITIKDISLEPDFQTYYALFDMNQDGIPELHLRPIVGGSYAIFTYLDGQIVLWHDGPDYEAPLNNGAILYERDGAAPTHINYYYLVLDSDGKETSKVYFSKYHSIDEGSSTESADYDEFIFDDKKVIEKEWNSMTNEYLSNSSDSIIWNEVLSNE